METSNPDATAIIILSGRGFTEVYVIVPTAQICIAVASGFDVFMGIHIIFIFIIIIHFIWYGFGWNGCA